MTNEELFKSGDFEELYKQNINFIYKQAYKFSKTVEFEECVSIGNLAFAKSLKMYNPSKNTKFISYLSTAIRNEILLYIRRNKKYLETLSLEYEYVDIHGNSKLLKELIESDFEIEEKVYNDLKIDKLYKSISNLPYKQRKAVAYRLDGVPYKQIQKDLKISKQYVYTLLTRAREGIRIMMQQEKEVG